MSILEAYQNMVEKNSYRVLASYSYDEEEKPFRSERIASQPPPPTDVGSDQESSGSASSLPIPFRNISSVPDHEEFIQLVINAKTLAQVENSSCDVTWRGYKTTITCDFHMSTDNLRKELVLALQNLISLNELDNKVI